MVKKQRFIEYTGTKKQVFVTLISNHGLVDNAYAREVVDAEVSLTPLHDLCRDYLGFIISAEIAATEAEHIHMHLQI